MSPPGELKKANQPSEARKAIKPAPARGPSGRQLPAPPSDVPPSLASPLGQGGEGGGVWDGGGDAGGKADGEGGVGLGERRGKGKGEERRLDIVAMGGESPRTPVSPSGAKAKGGGGRGGGGESAELTPTAMRRRASRQASMLTAGALVPGVASAGGVSPRVSSLASAGKSVSGVTGGRRGSMTQSLLHSGSMRRTGSLRGSGVFDEEKAKSTDAQNSWRRAAMSVAVEGMGGVKDMGQESAIAAKATRLFGLVDTDESGMVSLPEITSFLYTSPDFDHRQGHLLVNACRRHSSISKEEQGESLLSRSAFSLAFHDYIDKYSKEKDEDDSSTLSVIGGGGAGKFGVLSEYEDGLDANDFALDPRWEGFEAGLEDEASTLPPILNGGEEGVPLERTMSMAREELFLRQMADNNFRRVVLGGGATYEGQVDENDLPHGIGIKLFATPPVRRAGSGGNLGAHLSKSMSIAQAVALVLSKEDASLTNADGRKGGASGQGRRCWQAGRWVGGHLQGAGVVVMCDGSCYLGEMHKDHPEGVGVFRNAVTGLVYEGEVRMDKQDGTGILWARHGPVYFGEWLEGLRNGRGVMGQANPLWKKSLKGADIGVGAAGEARGLAAHLQLPHSLLETAVLFEDLVLVKANTIVERVPLSRRSEGGAEKATALTHGHQMNSMQAREAARASWELTTDLIRKFQDAIQGEKHRSWGMRLEGGSGGDWPIAASFGGPDARFTIPRIPVWVEALDRLQA